MPRPILIALVVVFAFPGMVLATLVYGWLMGILGKLVPAPYDTLAAVAIGGAFVAIIRRSRGPEKTSIRPS